MRCFNAFSSGLQPTEQRGMRGCEYLLTGENPSNAHWGFSGDAASVSPPHSLSSVPSWDVMFKLQPHSPSRSCTEERETHTCSPHWKDICCYCLNGEALKMQVSSAFCYHITHCTNGRSNVTGNCRQIQYFP